MKTHTPVSERVRAAMTVDDPDLLDDLRGLEKLALSRSVHAAGNGRMEQWWGHLKKATAVVVAVVTFVFFAGGEWHAIRAELATLPTLRAEVRALADVTHVIATVREELRITREELRETRKELDSVQRADEYYRRNPIRTPRLPAGGS